MEVLRRLRCSSSSYMYSPTYIQVPTSYTTDMLIVAARHNAGVEESTAANKGTALGVTVGNKVLEDPLA